MASEEQEIVSKLDKPGAGLPLLQEWVLRHIMFPILRRVISREKAFSIIEKEGLVTLMLAREVPEKFRSRQVLVPRMMGIEDSSRYWSIMMLLEHIIIVSHGVAELMTKLGREEQIDTVVDTAEVKPANNPDENVEQKYEDFLSYYRKQVLESVNDWSTSRCHVHPWFGCLNPQGWLVMLAVHQWIHKRQMQEICKRL